jgi:hypothetical protein
MTCVGIWKLKKSSVKQPFPCGHPCQPLRQSCRSSPKIQRSFREKRYRHHPWWANLTHHQGTRYLHVFSEKAIVQPHLGRNGLYPYHPGSCNTYSGTAHLSMQSLPKAFLGSVIRLEHLGGQSKSDHDFQVIHAQSFSLRMMT